MKNRIKMLGMGVVLLIACFFFAACTKGDDDEEQYLFYYVDDAKDTLQSYSYQPADKETDVMLSEVDEKLAGQDEEGNAYYPEEVQLLSHTYQDSVVTLNFSEAYYNLDPVQEILCRAAIVKNYLQADNVHYVLIQINGEDLKNADGSAVGMMNESSFLDSYGKDIMSYQHTDLTLYFADSTGTSLVPEERSLYYSSNSTVEKVVVEQLLQGPQSEGDRTTIPSGTGILNVSVADEIAYINLDENFLTGSVDVDPQITIYSIVNSVIEAGNVKRVQISVNGDYKQTYRDDISLNQLFEFQKDLVADS